MSSPAAVYHPHPSEASSPGGGFEKRRKLEHPGGPGGPPGMSMMGGPPPMGGPGGPPHPGYGPPPPGYGYPPPPHGASGSPGGGLPSPGSGGHHHPGGPPPGYGYPPPHHPNDPYFSSRGPPPPGAYLDYPPPPGMSGPHHQGGPHSQHHQGGPPGHSQHHQGGPPPPPGPPSHHPHHVQHNPYGPPPTPPHGMSPSHRGGGHQFSHHHQPPHAGHSPRNESERGGSNNFPPRAHLPPRLSGGQFSNQGGQPQFNDYDRRPGKPPQHAGPPQSVRGPSPNRDGDDGNNKDISPTGVTNTLPDTIDTRSPEGSRNLNQFEERVPSIEDPPPQAPRGGPPPPQVGTPQQGPRAHPGSHPRSHPGSHQGGPPTPQGPHHAHQQQGPPPRGRHDGSPTPQGGPPSGPAPPGTPMSMPPGHGHSPYGMPPPGMPMHGHPGQHPGHHPSPHGHPNMPPTPHGHPSHHSQHPGQHPGAYPGAPPGYGPPPPHHMPPAPHGGHHGYPPHHPSMPPTPHGHHPSSMPPTPQHGHPGGHPGHYPPQHGPPPGTPQFHLTPPGAPSGMGMPAGPPSGPVPGAPPGSSGPGGELWPCNYCDIKFTNWEDCSAHESTCPAAAYHHQGGHPGGGGGYGNIMGGDPMRNPNSPGMAGRNPRNRTLKGRKMALASFPNQGHLLCDENAEYAQNDDRDTYLLSTPVDGESLSDRQCYVRSHFVELFIATSVDVSARHSRGAQKLSMNQIGLRCAYCVKLKPRDRAERAICYPSSISRIYQTVADMQRFHFESCVAIPPKVLHTYKSLKTTRPRGVGSPQSYWDKSAREIGLVDTKSGIQVCQVTEGMAKLDIQKKSTVTGMLEMDGSSGQHGQQQGQMMQGHAELQQEQQLPPGVSMSQMHDPSMSQMHERQGMQGQFMQHQVPVKEEHMPQEVMMHHQQQAPHHQGGPQDPHSMAPQSATAAPGQHGATAAVVSSPGSENFSGASKDETDSKAGPMTPGAPPPPPAPSSAMETPKAKVATMNEEADANILLMLKKTPESPPRNASVGSLNEVGDQQQQQAAVLGAPAHAGGGEVNDAGNFVCAV